MTLLSTLAALSVALADAPQTIDLEQATTLGLPGNHRAFADCDCVGMAWSDPDRILDLPADDITEFRHVVGEPFDRLVVVTTVGSELELEQAPCAFIASQAQMYTIVLDRPVVRVDAAGAPTRGECPDPLREVLSWKAERDATHNQEVVASVASEVALASVQVTAHGRDASSIETQSRRAWAALRPQMGHCWAREGDPAIRPTARMRLVADADGTVRDVRLVGKGTGSERVDTCLTDVMARAALSTPPARSSRVSVELTWADLRIGPVSWRRCGPCRGRT